MWYNVAHVTYLRLYLVQCPSLEPFRVLAVYSSRHLFIYIFLLTTKYV